MAKFRKATNTQFNLAKQSGRVGLLCGITAGTVTAAEIEHAVLKDTEPRTYRKPVVVPDFGYIPAREQRFDSITEAAHYLVTWLGDTWGQNEEYARKLDAMKHRITRYCNADNVLHYYWAE